MRRWIALLLAPAGAASAFVALVVDPTTGLVAGATAVMAIGAFAVARTVWRLAGEEEAPAPGATAVNGSHATVDVPTAQGMRRVRLTDEGARGTDEFDPPPTPWRINGRLTAVLR